MASSNQADHNADADLAQAFQDVAKGERTAAALEARLAGLERKLDDLLASVDANEAAMASARERNAGQIDPADGDKAKKDEDDNRNGSTEKA